MKIVAPWSAGLDSTFMIIKLLNDGYEVYPIYVDFKTITTEYEIQALSKLYEILHSKYPSLHNVQVFEVEGKINSMLKNYNKPKLYLDIYNSVSSQGVPLIEFYFPVRNLIILSLAVAYAESEGIDVVAFATSKTDQLSIRDLHITFVKAVNSILDIISPVRIITPVIEHTREEEWLNLKYMNLIDYIASCHKPINNKACGKCSHCLFDIEMRNKYG